MTVDVELRRGVWIEGKITDKTTGQPVRGAVEYFALSGNPNLRDYPGFVGGLIASNHVRAKDGRLVPGRRPARPRPGRRVSPGPITWRSASGTMSTGPRDDSHCSRIPILISFTSNYWHSPGSTRPGESIR